MPSAEFMRNVMGHGAVIEDESAEIEEPVEDEVAAPPDEESEEERPEDEEQPGEEVEEPGEPVEEPSAEGEFGQFQSVEALRKGYEDTRAYAQEQARARAEAARERDEALQAMAYLQGQIEATQRESGESFQEWAEEYIENDPERGLMETRALAEETGDYGAAYAYVDLWAQNDPYRASTARVYLDMEVAMRQRAAAQPEQPDASAEIISQAWRALVPEFPDLQEGNEVLGGAVGVLRQDRFLTDMLRSGDVEKASWAIRTARATYIASRPATRRVSTATRDAVAADKARATIAQGNGVPDRRRVPDVVPKEFEGSMNAFEKWGMLREE